MHSSAPDPTIDPSSAGAAAPRTPIQSMLQRYSVEVTAKDRKGMEAAVELLPRTSEVFVANLPKEPADVLVAACAQLNRSGVTCVPHIVARNTHSLAELDDTLARLAGEAGVDRALVLGGDRDEAVGPYDASLQLMQTGPFQKHGINNLYIGCHPEGHPRVADSVLWPALLEKIAFAREAGFDIQLVSQFAFEAAPFITLAKRLRADGVTEPLRIGVAGPANRTTLIKFAIMC